MMFKLYFLTVAVAALLVQPVRIANAESSAQVQDDVVELDPAHTDIDFMLPGYLHTTHGRLTLKDGTIRIDPATGKATGEVVIDAASEDSSEDLRDAITKHAVLEVDRNPEITFTIQRIQGVRGAQGDFYGQIAGLMQLHGEVHPITVWARGPLIGDQLTATCDFLVPYTEWGLDSPNVLSPTQIINSIRRSNSGFITKIFPIFAYMLPALRKIPPDLFWVSDLVDVKVETSGHIIWAPQPEARKVTVIVPQH